MCCEISIWNSKGKHKNKWYAIYDLLYFFKFRPVWVGQAPVLDQAPLQHFPADTAFQSGSSSLDSEGNPCQTSSPLPWICPSPVTICRVKEFTLHFQQSSIIMHCGAWRLSGRFYTLCLEGRRFESHSSHHLRALDKSFIRSCLLRFSVLTLTQYQCCSWEHLWVVVDLKRRYKNIRNEWMNELYIIIIFIYHSNWQTTIWL